MNLLQALPELQKLIDGLPVNTSNEHETVHAVLANLHVRLKNLETAIETAAEEAK